MARQTHAGRGTASGGSHERAGVRTSRAQICDELRRRRCTAPKCSELSDLAAPDRHRIRVRPGNVRLGAERAEVAGSEIHDDEIALGDAFRD